MVKLEKTLAEVEVFGREVDSHLSKRNIAKNFADVVTEAEEAYSAYKLAKKAIRKGESAHYVGNLVATFALSVKNLADNLNKVLQKCYGSYRGNLKDLERNIENAPKTKDGESLYDLFMGVHDCSRENPLTVARNKRGHGESSSVLRKGENGRSSYVLEGRDEPDFDLQGWLTETVEDYFSLARVVFETIGEDFSPSSSNASRRYSIFGQRLKNFKGRHERSLKYGMLSALLAGSLVGFFGYQAWQDEVEKTNRISNEKEGEWAKAKIQEVRAGLLNISLDLSRINDKFISNSMDFISEEPAIKDQIDSLFKLKTEQSALCDSVDMELLSLISDLEGYFNQ